MEKVFIIGNEERERTHKEETSELMVSDKFSSALVMSSSIILK